MEKVTKPNHPIPPCCMNCHHADATVSKIENRRIIRKVNDTEFRAPRVFPPHVHFIGMSVIVKSVVVEFGDPVFAASGKETVMAYFCDSHFAARSQAE